MTTEQLTIRNQGYISSELQNKISRTTLMFAGCGLGSVPAESATRLGFQKFILVDNDTIEIHNLNRQAFTSEDIGRPKVEALRKRILQINPTAQVEAINELVSPKNVHQLVEKSDFIIDTIDFLDLGNIVGLHDAAHGLSKPIFSLFTAGWGAVGIYVPAEKRARSWIRDLFEIGDANPSEKSYVGQFFQFFSRISSGLDPQVQKDMKNVMDKMRDGTPCPASHVAGGAACASALSLKILESHLSSQKIPSAPQFIYLNLNQLIQTSLLELTK